MTRRYALQAMQRFYSQIQVPPCPQGCQAWMGRRQPMTTKRLAYGEFSLAGKVEKAHRLAWRFAHGPIPPGLCVLHHCDVPWCVNVDHLFLGTRRDNVSDMVRKRRQAIGERNRGKLTAEDVRTIRTSPETIGALARRFGVNRSTVSLARSGKKWRDVAVSPVQNARAQKLTPAQAQAILALRGTMPRKAIARQFGVSLSLVNQIHARRAWKHLEEPTPCQEP